MATVSTTAELIAAIENARAGDEIILENGRYNLPLNGAQNRLIIQDKQLVSSNLTNFSAADGVTIRAATPGEATIVGQIEMRGSSGFTFQDLRFQTTARTLQPGEENRLSKQDGTALSLMQSHHITIENSELRGHTLTDVWKGRPGGSESIYVGAGEEYTSVQHGGGISVRQSSDVTIRSNTFVDLYGAIGFGQGGTAANGAKIISENTVITGNHFLNMRSEGIRGTDHNNTIIDGNIFEDFNPLTVTGRSVSDHADMIQFWATGAVHGVTNFTVNGNVLFDPDSNIQGIFGHMSNVSDADRDSVAFSNFTITQNLIYTASTHGITLGSVEGGEVSGNTILPNISATGALVQFTPGIFLESSERSISIRPHLNENIRYSKDLAIFANLVPDTSDDGATVRLFSSAPLIDPNTGQPIGPTDARANNIQLDELIPEMQDNDPSNDLGINTNYDTAWAALNITNRTGGIGPDNFTFAASGSEVAGRAPLSAYFGNVDGVSTTLADLALTQTPAGLNGYGSYLSRVQDLHGELSVGHQFGAARSVVPVPVEQPTEPDAETLETFDNVIFIPVATSPTEDRNFAFTDAAETIIGTAGRDNIYGAGGDDYIVLGGGKDWFVRGGLGADTFEFDTTLPGGAKIHDWEDDVDSIVLTGGLGFADANVSLGSNGVDVIVGWNADGVGGDETRLILLNVDLADVTAADFNEGSERPVTPSSPTPTEPATPTSDRLDQNSYSSVETIPPVASDSEKFTFTDDDEWIIGTGGRDNILAAGGDDYIVLGGGKDWFVTGGAGADYFEFNTTAPGGAKIHDWQDGVDRVVLTGGLGFADADVAQAPNGQDVVLGWNADGVGGDETRLILRNVDVGDVSGADFLML